MSESMILLVISVNVLWAVVCVAIVVGIKRMTELADVIEDCQRARRDPAERNEWEDES